MLPLGCGNPGVLGTRLGLPQELQQELSISRGDLGERSKYAHNKAGHVKSLSSPGPNGGVSTWNFKVDVDGLAYETTSPDGAQTRIERDFRGMAKSVKVYDGAQLLRAKYMQRDKEGRLLTECVEVSPGSCAFASGPTIADFGAARDTAEPSYLLTTTRYTPEGLVLKVRDPMGHDDELRIRRIRSDQSSDRRAGRCARLSAGRACPHEDLFLTTRTGD